MQNSPCPSLHSLPAYNPPGRKNQDAGPHPDGLRVRQSSRAPLPRAHGTPGMEGAPRLPLRARARWDCVRPTTLPPAAPPRSQAKARREVAHRRPQQQRRTQTHAAGAPTTRLAPAGAALAGTRPTVPSGTPLPWEALLTRWAQPQSPRGAPGEQGPAAPTPAHGDLEAQGCEEAREAGTAGGGLTPANVSRTLGGPTASYTGHGRPSKWLTPAHGWRRP